MRVLFLGSGPSVSLPILSCTSAVCQCCQSARVDPSSKNNRGNTSVLITSDDGKHVLIDCGKTFYAAARRHLYQGAGGPVTKLDGVVITHGHADAILGIDDLRHYTRNREPQDGPLTVYCDSATMQVTADTFPYLVDTRTATGSGEVARLAFDSGLEPQVERVIGGIRFVPLLVEHGLHPDSSPYHCLAFLIAGQLVYMSDVSRVPEQVYAYIDTVPQVQVLVVDCLFKDKDMQSHVGWPGARDIIRRVKPKRAYLVGVDHCIEHDSFNRFLHDFADCDCEVQLAFDGMVLHL